MVMVFPKWFCWSVSRMPKPLCAAADRRSPGKNLLFLKCALLYLPRRTVTVCTLLYYWSTVPGSSTGKNRQLSSRNTNLSRADKRESVWLVMVATNGRRGLHYRMYFSLGLCSAQADSLIQFDNRIQIVSRLAPLAVKISNHQNVDQSNHHSYCTTNHQHPAATSVLLSTTKPSSLAETETETTLLLLF